MTPLFLNDEHVTQYLSPAIAVDIMEQVFLARTQNQYAGVPRWNLPFHGGQMVFTVGGAGDSVGFRAYLRGKNLTHDDQLNIVWEQSTGKLLGIVSGVLLGAMRTGAIGGVAAKYLAPKNAEILAIIGTGKQAMSQVLSIASVVPSLKEVRVYSRNPEKREKFCAESAQKLPHLKIYPTENAESAVRGADMVVGATTSQTPVMMGEWIKDGAHVTTLGSKSVTSREIDEALVNRARFVVTDSPEQIYAAEFATLLEGTNHQLVDLATVVSGQGQRPSGISLFLSVGLAGTEVALASYLIDKVQSGRE